MHLTPAMTAVVVALIAGIATVIAALINAVAILIAAWLQFGGGCPT